MEKKLGTENLNEKLTMFHGTGHEQVDSICNQSFDWYTKYKDTLFFVAADCFGFN